MTNNLDTCECTITDNNKKSDENEAATFESAVTMTGFGKFNILLILVVLPGTWAPLFETTTMSYIFAFAHCDLELSLESKGYLNAITFLGMVASAPLWGFLFDTLGRRKLLIGGYLLDTIVVFISSFAQSTLPLMICKFLGGLIINGPYAAMITYIAEFHCSKYRSRIQMALGTMITLGNVILPLLAWLILPKFIDWSIFDGYIKLHSWNAYLLLCSLPALYSAIMFLFLPESPKFLMTVGQNEKALKIFQKVYHMNTGQPAESFPIKQLIDETKIEDGSYGGKVTTKRNMTQALKEGWQQIAPLFKPPYVSKLVLVCFIQFCIIQSHNMLRLWAPQIFQAIEDYQQYSNNSDSSLCIILDDLKPTPTSENCIINSNNSMVYINSIIVATVTVCSYTLAGFVINIAGKKKLIVILGFASGITSCLIYLSENRVTAVALSSIFISLTSVCAFILISVIVDLFPTTLRTLTVALTMMMGRAGAMCGNLLFSVLLRLGCQLPFFYIGTSIIVSAVFSFLLPNSENRDLK